MQYEGVLTKMQTEFADPIQYYLVFDDGFLHMNQLLGKDVELVKMGTRCLGVSRLLLKPVIGSCVPNSAPRI
jgi:hypothetical protein